MRRIVKSRSLHRWSFNSKFLGQIKFGYSNSHQNEYTMALLKNLAILALIIGMLVLFTKCSSNDDNGNFGDPQEGYVTGLAKDGTGTPLEGVKVLIDNSIFFNSGINTITNEKGKFQVKIPNGSWYAFATHEVPY